jgi:tRNA pseudouridine32 synthase / 23S rRNA pseudouridine746 synthase
MRDNQAPQVLKTHYSGASAQVWVDFLAAQTGLPKAAIKRALDFGGGWIRPAQARQLQRCRKAKQSLRPGDYCEFYYDPALLAAPLPSLHPLDQYPEFGFWYKPPQQVTQGSRFGDANSLERMVAKARQAPVYLVHRLDREARGLVLLAYTPQAAAKLSALFAQGGMEKHYQAEALGDLPPEGQWLTPIEGKAARTDFHRHGTSPRGHSWLCIRLHSGRHHQIRRHSAEAGCPLLGDPVYGRGNACVEGLQLAAVALRFSHPFSPGHWVEQQLPAHWCLFPPA